jgi:hypothetical protein
VKNKKQAPSGTKNQQENGRIEELAESIDAWLHDGDAAMPDSAICSNCPEMQHAGDCTCKKAFVSGHEPVVGAG